jgi:hypothetical protein
MTTEKRYEMVTFAFRDVQLGECFYPSKKRFDTLRIAIEYADAHNLSVWDSRTCTVRYNGEKSCRN